MDNQGETKRERPKRLGTCNKRVQQNPNECKIMRRRFAYVLVEEVGEMYAVRKPFSANTRRLKHTSVTELPQYILAICKPSQVRKG